VPSEAVAAGKVEFRPPLFAELWEQAVAGTPGALLFGGASVLFEMDERFPSSSVKPWAQAAGDTQAELLNASGQGLFLIGSESSSPARLSEFAEVGKPRARSAASAQPWQSWTGWPVEIDSVFSSARARIVETAWLVRIWRAYSLACSGPQDDALRETRGLTNREFASSI
jgi:hypothetical protein